MEEAEEIDVEIVDFEAPAPEDGAEAPAGGEAPEEGVAAAFDAPPVALFDADDEAPVDVSAQLLELKRLRAQVNQPAPAAPKQLGAKPKLADFDFDGEQFEAALDAWHTANSAQQAQLQAQQAEYDAMVQRYQASRTEVAADDYEAVELAVQDALDLAQQGVLIQGSELGAKLVYALGRSKSRLAELAKIKNPIKFAFAVAKLEQELMAKSKTKTKAGGKAAPQAAPAPEGRVRSSGTGSGGGNANERQLERLREEAAKTGDISKVLAFKRQMKARKTG